MEAADVGHATSPFQNLPARSSGREIDVKTPVHRSCRMPQDVGIHPLDDVVHMQLAGRRSKGQIVDCDLMHPRTGPQRRRDERDKAECQRSPCPYLRSNRHRSLLQLVHELLGMLLMLLEELEAGFQQALELRVL